MFYILNDHSVLPTFKLIENFLKIFFFLFISCLFLIISPLFSFFKKGILENI